MNVQQLILKGIKEQLFIHNYLVLPGFGGFVLKFGPAHFSGTGTFILPPSKTVSFNAQLKQNDGLLAVWLQQQLNCTASEALTHLQEFAGFCSGILSTRRRLSLDTIGFFYLDFENNICFEPQHDSNFLMKSFGLTPVSVKELEPETTEIKKETVFVDRSVTTEQLSSAPKQKRNYLRLMVPAALLIVFLSGLLLFVSTVKTGGQLQASLLSGNTKGSYVPLIYPQLTLLNKDEGNAAYVADANGVATLNLENNKTLAVKALNNSVNSKPSTGLKSIHKATRITAGEFEIVLGCFTVSENAQRMAGKLSRQNIAAFVSGKNAKGMYVVSNGTFGNKDAALSQLDKIKSAYPKAWINKRL